MGTHSDVHTMLKQSQYLEQDISDNNKHKNSPLIYGERRAAGNNCILHEQLLQEHLQEYSFDYSFLSLVAARRKANVCQTFSKYSR